jgi:pre-60S factor REI1
LFCNHINSSLDDNLTHMLKMHGLFIPDKDRLVLDAETLIAYFHLIIFGYLECLYCGTQRNSAEAAQQHMIGKAHCKFDISSEDSEFRHFYDFDSSHEDDEVEEDAGTSTKRSLPFAFAGLVYTVLAILEGVVPPLPPFSRLLADLTEIVLTAGAELESV